jgi:hypothetical protein
MTTHPTEEELILHFYGERRSEEATVDAHLATCAECQSAWSALREMLQMVDDAAVPEPGPGFERTMWARVRQALPAQDELSVARSSGRRRGAVSRLVSFPSLAAAAAVVVAVSLAGYFARTISMPATTNQAPTTAGVTPAQTTGDAAIGRERVLLTALNDHFQQSELLLVELMNAPDSGGDRDFERQTAGDLLDSSRLYRVSAQQNGKTHLAAMLQDLESVLVEIARSPDQINRKDFNSLRARIDGDNLLFKVRAVSRQIQDRQRVLSTE